MYSFAHLCSSYLSASDTEPLGRLDYAALSNQAQMEIVVGGLENAFLQRLQDGNGSFNDVCDWLRVRCDDDKNVISSDFSDVMSGSVNLDYLPPKIESFEIFRPPGSPKGSIAGTMDIASLPRTLRELDVMRNVLSGPLEIPKLPPKMEKFAIAGNLFFGECDISHLPATMRYFCAQMNKFRGTVCLDALPDSLVELSLRNNFLSGTLNLTNLPPGLVYLHMAGNEFCGKFELMQRNGVWLWETDFRNNKFAGTAVVHW